jgi:ABC-type molybdenum transport system ATPase subunit/photorepair protein PhrA
VTSPVRNRKDERDERQRHDTTHQATPVTPSELPLTSRTNVREPFLLQTARIGMRSKTTLRYTADSHMRIELANLTKRYGSARPLNNISLTLEPGQIIALVGVNGAGKTTLLRCLSAIVTLTAERSSMTARYSREAE